jgi:hypothetical protein
MTLVKLTVSQPSFCFSIAKVRRLSPLMLCEDTCTTATSGLRKRIFSTLYVFWRDEYKERSHLPGHITLRSSTTVITFGPGSMTASFTCKAPPTMTKLLMIGKGSPGT